MVFYRETPEEGEEGEIKLSTVKSPTEICNANNKQNKELSNRRGGSRCTNGLQIIHSPSKEIKHYRGKIGINYGKGIQMEVSEKWKTTHQIQTIL